MSIESFKGGTPAARGKLNRMRELAEAVELLQGDAFIAVTHNANRIALALRLDKLMERIPRPRGTNMHFPVTLELENSAATGDEDTDCGFTYTVMDLNGNILKKNGAGDDATGMVPIKRRFIHTKYKLPEEGVPFYGVAFYDYGDDPQLVLWDANEIPDQYACAVDE
jgi:hypothetical protein